MQQQHSASNFQTSYSAVGSISRCEGFGIGDKFRRRYHELIDGCRHLLLPLLVVEAPPSIAISSKLCRWPCKSMQPVPID